MASSCPTKVELEELLQGTLPPVNSAALDQHLLQCAACRQQLNALAGGNESWLKAQPTPLADSLDSPPLREAMNRLKTGQQMRAPDSPEALVRQGTRLRYLGDYEILDELGRGGMGVVYRARQVSLQRDVAVKVILAGQLASTTDVRRFHVEAEAAAKLDHPNIVPIFEIGEHEGHHFFSMKLVEGGNLAEAIARGSRREEAQTSNPSTLKTQRSTKESEPPYIGCYDPKETANLMAAIARAVHYAHQRGVLHRDLKPGNILLDRNGRAYVTDFGLAKLIGHDGSLTRSATIMGSPNYMAPEQAAGRACKATTAADVYSLGAILYELLTGRPPFQSESSAQTLRLVLETEPISPTIYNFAVPAGLATICLKCLEKEPMRRYASAEQLSEDLERLIGGEPITARPITHAERVWRWCHRQTPLAATLMILCMLLLLGIAAVVWQWRRAEGAKAQIAEALPLENRRPTSSTASFVVGNTSGVFVRAFPNIEQAIQAADPGALIECRFTGDWPIEAIDLGEKPLLIRAAANTKPAFVITRRPGPLLRTRAPLALEGLTFKMPALESHPSLSTYHSPFNDPVIESSNAPLWMANCRIEMVGPLGGPLGGGCCIGLLDNSFAAFVNCELYAPVNGAIVHLHTALSLPASEPDRIIVRNCVQTGFSFVHPKDPRGFEMLIELTRNSTAIGSCAVGFTGLPRDMPVTIAATQNVFDVDYIVGSQPPARLEPAERLLRWIDATNVIQVKEGFTRTRPALTTVEQWQSFVGGPGGGWVPVGLSLSDRIMKLRTDMNQFTPERFLLSPAEKEQLERIVPGLSNDLGVQPDICGPGEPYDRWKRSPAYANWQKEINRLFFEQR